MLVHGIENAENYIISRIYAPAQSRDKNECWEHLNQLHNTMMDIPWCLMGDFTKITYPNEKLGGTTPNVNRFQRLDDFLTNVNAEAL